jgi:hypothetical protein
MSVSVRPEKRIRSDPAYFVLVLGLVLGLGKPDGPSASRQRPICRPEYEHEHEYEHEGRIRI